MCMYIYIYIYVYIDIILTPTLVLLADFARGGEKTTTPAGPDGQRHGVRRRARGGRPRQHISHIMI